jgi:hypothetical protein
MVSGADVLVINGSTLYKIDPATGNRTTIASALPVNDTTNAVAVGDYLYVLKGTKLYLINKASGAGLVVVDAAWVGNGTGIATNGSQLFVAESGASGKSIRAVSPVDNG